MEKPAAMALRLEELADLGLKPVLTQRSSCDQEYRRDLGRSQRWLDCFRADEGFRRECREDACAATARRGLAQDPEELRSLWDPSPIPRAIQELLCDRSVPLSARRQVLLGAEKVKARRRYRAEAAGSHPVLKAWRARQLARAEMELGTLSEFLVHAPFAIELGRGCSVGCWFCSVDAPKLGDQALHTPANARLFRECLQALADLWGPEAARYGFCYWATDPLDNPDYEQYLLDFHEVLGKLPQTTTAQAHKHVDRVRGLLALSDERGGWMERFSVLTLKQWQAIHEAFAPDELAFVECVAQNKEALESGKAISGRALQVNRRRAEQGKEERVSELQTSTTACVSGFLLNLVDRRVRLITPCNASERWPLGYWVLGEGTFSDGLTLQNVLQELVDRHVTAAVRHDMPVRWRQGLTYQAEPDGFSVSSVYRRKAWKGDARLAHELQETQTAAQLAQKLDSYEETFAWLNRMFDLGLLEEEPA